MHEQEKDNCILVLRNVQKGSEVGIDYHSWYTGDKFQGISNIPPGFHFVFIRIADKYGEMSTRKGFFIYLNPGDMVSKCFKDDVEEFEHLEEHISDEELHLIFKYMAPYPYKECKPWPCLTKHVTSSLLDRVQPLCKKISSYTEVKLNKESVGNRMSRILLKNDSRTEETTGTDYQLNFTNIPNLLAHSPGELTKRNLDSSDSLNQLIDEIPDGENGLLGEFEFAFISFLIAQVYDAFEHWKQLLSLVCGCMEAVAQRTSFYEKFIDTICLQLDEIPTDFFLEINPQKNVIFHIFQDLFQNIAEVPDLTPSLLRKSSILKEKLFQQFNWEFEEVLEDEIPTVVEL